MKANLPEREPSFLKFWNEKHIYQRLLEKNKTSPSYILHDGPPYANGHIHFGHILNKVLKDIVVKYKGMSGHATPFIPGWDCHGLPIELGALKELKAEDAADPLKVRAACRSYAEGYIKIQSEEFQRLGLFGDWAHPYLTLTNQYEADIAREFLKLYLAGFIYQGKKPVHWCPSCVTALAEAEVEYEEVSSPSIYVPFFVVDPEKMDVKFRDKKVALVIWTTTPWTLPANLALAVGEAFDYVALEVNDKIYVVAHDLKDSFLKVLNKEGRVLRTWKGRDLESLETYHPFMNRTSQVVLGGHVTGGSGTGVVHIAPGHGQEDYVVGQKYGLETLCPIDEKGHFLKDSLKNSSFKEVQEWEGLFVKKANKAIIAFLEGHGFLLNPSTDQMTHPYPHCWRCKNPVLFRATQQWFLSLQKSDLRKRALQSINGEVQWIPSWGQDRIFGMIESRPDWCLSRQRKWGVPIIVHFCQECKTPLLDQKIGEAICHKFEEEGADAWWKVPSLLPQGTKCKCGSSHFFKEQSILDVWFDSGVSHAAVLERRLRIPADLYLEGSDQHRGWFHSSLLTSLATKNHAPYKAVLTHGFVVDGMGKKYSKSAKNYVPPENILKTRGAELLRAWVAAEDYRNDIRFSNEIVDVLSEVYRKIRNTCRFLLGNLYDFTLSDVIPPSKRTELDRYALSQLGKIVSRVEKFYSDFEFHGVHHALNKFFTVDLSATYLDILKDRLYCECANGFLRRSAQSTLYDLLLSLTPLLAPILSFTAEDIWHYIPCKENLPESVFLTPWPKTEGVDPGLDARWARIWKIRDEVLKVLEGARKKKIIGHPLDAKVLMSASGETESFLKECEKDWTQIFIVSQVQIVPSLENHQLKSDSVPSLLLSIEPAEGEKCARCWNYSTEVGHHATHPTLCGRCVKAVYA